MDATDKLIKDFETLRDVFVLIRQDYNNYTALFCEENEVLLTLIAPTFFSDIQEILVRDWNLQVSKIMDKAEVTIKGVLRENLTINLINNQLDKFGLSNQEINNISSEILGYGKLLKPFRDRLGAHFDREACLKGEELGGTSKELLEMFLKNLQKYSDLVGDKIGIGPLDFSCSSCSGDVFDFLKYLRKGEAGIIEKFKVKP
jgi:hypothetical protein